MNSARFTRHIVSVLLSLLLCLPALSVAQQPQRAFEQKLHETIVYVTRTGARYHREGCRHLKSKIPMSLKRAKEKGYTPCKVCRPPE